MVKKVLAEMILQFDVSGNRAGWVCEADYYDCDDSKSIRNIIGSGKTWKQAIAKAERQFPFPVEIEVIDTP